MARLVLLALPDLLWAAALAAGLAAAIWLLPVPSLRGVRHLGTGLPAVLTGAALILFAWAAPRASLTLSGLAFGVGGTKAILQLALQITLLLGFTARTVAGPGPVRRGAQLACLAAGILVFVLMFPLAGGLGLALAGLTAGAVLASLQAPPPRAPV